MAHAVARRIATGGALVVEAATGVGKTFAYLVPALLSGERVLVSTATKTLQDQLFGRDLPRLTRALHLPVRAALLKGRGSYLCLHRLEMARQQLPHTDRAALETLARVERWALTTRAGDLAELPQLDERSPVIALVTSTRENCLGGDCPKHRECHVNLARREAMAADLVVINHHLFFADLALRETGMAELLPTVRVAIFDEAHQLNEIGVRFLGLVVSTGQMFDLARDLLAAGLRHARGLADWPHLAAQLETAARQFRLSAQAQPAGARARWVDAVPEGVDAPLWQAGCGQLQTACDALGRALDTVSELAPDFARLQERVHTLRARLAHFARPADADMVRWLDAGFQLRLVESPLDIADAMRQQLPGLVPDAADSAVADAPPAGRGPAWIFVSATLGDDDRLSWFTQPCGLQQAEVLRVGSAFDFAHQAALYVPAQLPKPADARHSEEVALLVARAAETLGGRTLVLTTTLRALRAIGQILAERLASRHGIEVLVQGALPKRALIERFRQEAGHNKGCVLVASASFWEGVDVPGDALQLVVIDKLPFPPPGDPLVQARCQRLEAQGRSGFADYSVPEAAVALKQGAGRLIRSETDTGVLVICDTRLLQMGYGRRLLAALPPMRRLPDAAAFDAALHALAAGRAA
jgi:ATP-dependent DNA helicase DinG